MYVMLGTEAIISIVFRIINFVVVILFFVFIFKKYVLSAIKDNIARNKGLEKELLDRCNNIIRKDSELDVVNYDQSQICDYLLEKVKKWHGIFKNNLLANEKERALTSGAMAQRMNLQVERVTELQAYKKIAPQALELARNSLISTYEQEENGTKFLDQLIEHMEKNLQ